MIHRSILIVLILLVAITTSRAQLKHERNTAKLAAMYRETKADTNRVNVLLRWSAVLFDHQYNKRPSLDSAFLLASDSYRLSEALKFDKGREESICLKGNYYIRTRNDHSMDSLVKLATPTLKVRWLLESIAFCYAYNGNCKMDVDSLIHRLGDCVNLMQKEKQFLLAIRCMLNMADLYAKKREIENGAKIWSDALQYARENNSKEGEGLIFSTRSYFLHAKNGPQFLNDLIQCQKELAAQYPLLTNRDDILDMQKRISTIAYAICEFYNDTGSTHKAMDIALSTIRLIEANGATLEVPELLNFTGRTFSSAGKHDLALKYYMMAYNTSIRNYEPVDPCLFKFIIRSYVALGRAKEGLEFLQKDVRIETHDLYCQHYIFDAFGETYLALGSNSEAEQYFLKSLRIAKSLDPLLEAISSFPLGKLYVRTKDYEKAKFYLERSIKLAGVDVVPVWVQRDMQQLLFKADSATGDYVSAIDHLNQYRSLNDSIFNINRNRQIEELKIQFENDKKDTELKSKEQNIQLLTKQSELQHAELQQTIILRNSFIAGVIVLLALLALTYNRYRLKQKTNKLLEDKQQKINLANNSLQHANEQLQDLLYEKEWLVKEIHHRVKNNLQIVVSLLNTQANHLPESEALTAIRESQQRMQVISLLHQRLYRMEESRLVDMTTYIRELTGYISESYRTTKNVYLVIETENVFLDISQAVSIGLILNESITNSYKYAFNERLNGLIKISLEATKPNNLTLRISDNGSGLSPEFYIKKKTSMGMRLIETLADQLDGHLSIENENGVVISIQFNPIQSELKSTSNEIEIVT